jgi:anti-sigma B factor antagonist
MQRRADDAKRGNEVPDMAQPLHGAATTPTTPTTPGLALRRLDDEERVLEVVGEIDVATSPILRSELIDLLTDAPTRVTLDFAQVSFIDSSGLGVLVGALKRMREHSPDAVLRVAHTQGPVRNVFGITGLDELFELS